MPTVSIISHESGDLGEWSSSSGASVSSTAHNGNYSLDISSSGNAIKDTSQSANFYVAFYFRFASFISEGAFVTISTNGGGTILASYGMNTSRQLFAQATGGTRQYGSTVLAVDQWHFVEFRWTAGGGSNAIAEVRYNESVEATCTNGTGTSNGGRFTIQQPGGMGTPLYDDIRAAITSYPGAALVSTIRPNAAGDETGATGSFADIDDDPINDTTGRTENSGPAFVDNLTTVTNAGTLGLTKIGVRASRSNGPSREHYIRAKRGASTENSPDLLLDTAVLYLEYFLTSIPPTSQSELDAYQAGMSQSASGGRQYTCTELYVTFEHFPPAAVPRLIPLVKTNPGFHPMFMQ